MMDEVFCDLMELPSGERLSALESMSDLSDQLKSDVRCMLKEAEEAEKYFTGTSVAVKMQPTTSHVKGAGDMCGPYKLVRKLGEGGFGLVWLAQQEKPLKRTVALKVIKAGMDTDEVLARFDAEKQALARMEHPNISKVLDAGMTENGRPYFVMELLDGMSITRYCHEHALSTRERLRLFADICAAINHAHQKGVIHRDIKPSNVIVTEIEGKAVVKVIDFGIAKAIDGQLTDHTLRTRVEQWIGTPAYMSPEQASLAFTDLDTRSDIYTLGVLLYELITGVAPFDAATLQKAGYEEMRRIIREEEPPRPSARITTESKKATVTGDTKTIPTDITARGIASELDWIVMKSIEKSRDRRYGTAAALADDIGRYLADEPIEARPPSSLYILTKFARRHRLGIYIGSAFLILIAGVVLLSVLLALRATEAENIAQESLTTVRKERDSKNKALEEVLKERDSKNKALEDAEAVSSLLGDVFQRPQPGVDGRNVTVLEALDSAALKLESQLITQPQRRAKLRSVLADTYETLGIFDRSVKLRQQNYEVLEQLHDASHAQTRKALRKVIEAAEAKGDSKLALQYALLERDSLQENSATANETETSMRSLIRGWFGIGKRNLAIEHQLDLIRYSLKMFGEESSEHVKSRWELRQYEAGSSSTSEDKSRVGLMAIEKKYAELVEAHGSMHAETIKARMKLAGQYRKAGRTLEALLHLKSLQASMIELYGWSDDRTIDLQRKLVSTYNKLNRSVDVVRIQQVIVNTLRERDGLKAQVTVDAEDYLSRCYHYADVLSKERAAYREDLLQGRIKLFGKYHPNTVHLHLIFDVDTFGNLFGEGAEEKVKTMERAVEIVLKEHADCAHKSRGGRKVIRSKYASGTQVDRNDTEKRLCREAADIVSTLARAYVSAGRTREAMAHYEKCAPYMLDDTWVNGECATFQLWMGNDEGYRKTRRNIFRYHGADLSSRKANLEILERAIWVSCLAALDNEQQRLELKKFVEQTQKIRKGIHVEVVKRVSWHNPREMEAAAFYRMGMYKDALTTFEESNRLRNFKRSSDSDLDGYKNTPVWGVFVVAMTHHQLGNKKEAIRLLALGKSKLRFKTPSVENPVVKYYIGGGPLSEWIMYKEAKALISEP